MKFFFPFLRSTYIQVPQFKKLKKKKYLCNNAATSHWSWVVASLFQKKTIKLSLIYFLFNNNNNNNNTQKRKFSEIETWKRKTWITCTHSHKLWVAAQIESEELLYRLQQIWQRWDSGWLLVSLFFWLWLAYPLSYCFSIFLSFFPIYFFN